MESTVEKREFGFLWKIIASYMLLVGANILIKNLVECPCLASQVSAAGMAGLGILISVIYAIKLKPAINQLLLFILCIGTTFASIVFYVYNLPYKNVLGIISS